MADANYQYYFVLGANHSLSKVEIINVLLKKSVKFDILEASEEILLIETASRLERSLLDGFSFYRIERPI